MRIAMAAFFQVAALAAIPQEEMEVNSATLGIERFLCMEMQKNGVRANAVSKLCNNTEECELQATKDWDHALSKCPVWALSPHPRDGSAKAMAFFCELFKNPVIFKDASAIVSHEVCRKLLKAPSLQLWCMPVFGQIWVSVAEHMCSHHDIPLTTTSPETTYPWRTTTYPCRTTTYPWPTTTSPWPVTTASNPFWTTTPAAMSV